MSIVSVLSKKILKSGNFTHQAKNHIKNLHKLKYTFLETGNFLAKPLLMCILSSCLVLQLWTEFGAWKEMGLEMLTPRATFYCWGEIPQGYSSEEFSFKLLEESNVWMIPGSAYGEKGEGYVRIANAQPVERIAEAMERLTKFMS